MNVTYSQQCAAQVLGYKHLGWLPLLESDQSLLHEGDKWYLRHMFAKVELDFASWGEAERLTRFVSCLLLALWKAGLLEDFEIEVFDLDGWSIWRGSALEAIDANASELEEPEILDILTLFVGDTCTLSRFQVKRRR